MLFSLRTFVFLMFFFFFLFSSVQLLSRVRLFATQWITACQASLSFTNSQSLFKLMSIESVMPSSYLILCHSLLLLPPIPPSIRVFSKESTLHMRWPSMWSEKMLEMISIFLNLPRLDLWHRMWSILENVPCALEKKVKLIVLGWNVL